MKDLKYLTTQTVIDFKQANGGNAIQLIHNPKNGNLFFNCGALVGAVSTKLTEDVLKNIPAEELRISLVEGTNGAQFNMLHKASENNVIRVL